MCRSFYERLSQHYCRQAIIYFTFIPGISMWSVFKSVKPVGFRLRFDQSGQKKMIPPPTSITCRMCANICAVFKACARCRWPTSMPERTPKPRSPRASSSSLSRRNSGNERIWCDGCQRLSEKFCWLCTANKQLEFTFCVVMCKFRPEAVSKVCAEAIGDWGVGLQMWPGLEATWCRVGTRKPVLGISWQGNVCFVISVLTSFYHCRGNVGGNTL